MISKQNIGLWHLPLLSGRRQPLLQDRIVFLVEARCGPTFSGGTVQKFRDLKVWQRSHQLTLKIYGLASRFPSQERFGVTSQLQRAAVSVPSNIAEGSKRRQPRDYAHFLNIAEASLAETEYLLILSRDLGYLQEDKTRELFPEIEEISKMLNALYTKVTAQP